MFVLEDGKAAFVPVKTGISSETDIEIAGGELKAGDARRDRARTRRCATSSRATR